MNNFPFPEIPNIGNNADIGKIVVLTGAGISQESGLSTFRDSNGLWENHNIYDVATPEAWKRNPSLVLEFYNQRRKQLLKASPNDAHNYLVRLSEKFDVRIITQNVDDLHERAGSKNVLHLHGQLRKSRSSKYENLVYDIEGWELRMGDICERGAQLRPHVVWFGEMVPMIEPAMELVRSADMVWIIGTSLAVYPAAGLLHEVRRNVPVIAIDPGNPEIQSSPNVHHIKEKAAQCVKNLVLKMLDS